MKVFTYHQYIKCIHTLRLNAVLQVAEENEEYHLEKERKKYYHDKFIKKLLEEEEEVRELINFFMKPKKEIKTNQLIKYPNNYITKKYRSKEANLIYKLKGQEIFFLIVHQSTVDTTISYRILNDCIDIIQEWSKNKKMRKSLEYPIVVPIVIYTGDKNWKIPKNVKEKQISNYVFERNKINLEYNLIDLNKISKQTLLEQDKMFGYVLLIEKSKSKEELIENLSLMMEKTKEQEKLENLINSPKNLLTDILEENRKKKN